jgi:hypothetical protein
MSIVTVVPDALEDAVYAAARAVLGDAPLAPAALARAVVDRSRRYTSERDQLARPGDPVGDLAARAAFFTIADAMKIAIPLGELAGRGALPDRTLRVTDLGAGCGAMTLGLLAVRGSATFEITAIDRDAKALAIAERAVAQFAPGVGFTTRTADATRVALDRADLIVAGTLLNELAPDAALALVERALAAITDDGAVILIEPALRDTARALHAIRDATLARGTGHVFAPCTRRIAPCPALADPSDWCHEDRALRLPPRTAALAQRTHLRDSGMKFAYLVLRRQPLDLAAAGDRAWRVVSAPLVAKGKRELIGCSGCGRLPLRLLKRHRSDANRTFNDADRGDVLEIARRGFAGPRSTAEGSAESIDAAPADGRVEITGDTRVTRA